MYHNLIQEWQPTLFSVPVYTPGERIVQGMCTRKQNYSGYPRVLPAIEDLSEWSDIWAHRPWDRSEESSHKEEWNSNCKVLFGKQVLNSYKNSQEPVWAEW